MPTFSALRWPCTVFRVHLVPNPSLFLAALNFLRILDQNVVFPQLVSNAGSSWSSSSGQIIYINQEESFDIFKSLLISNSQTVFNSTPV